MKLLILIYLLHLHHVIFPGSGGLVVRARLVVETVPVEPARSVSSDNDLSLETHLLLVQSVHLGRCLRISDDAVSLREPKSTLDIFTLSNESNVVIKKYKVSPAIELFQAGELCLI